MGIGGRPNIPMGFIEFNAFPVCRARNRERLQLFRKQELHQQFQSPLGGVSWCYHIVVGGRL
jgi:hypothetical protein